MPPRKSERKTRSAREYSIETRKKSKNVDEEIVESSESINDNENAVIEETEVVEKADNVVDTDDTNTIEKDDVNTIEKNDEVVNKDDYQYRKEGIMMYDAIFEDMMPFPAPLPVLQPPPSKLPTPYRNIAHILVDEVEMA